MNLAAFYVAKSLPILGFLTSLERWPMFCLPLLTGKKGVGSPQCHSSAPRAVEEVGVEVVMAPVVPLWEGVEAKVQAEESLKTQAVQEEERISWIRAGCFQSAFLNHTHLVQEQEDPPKTPRQPTYIKSSPKAN